MAGEEAWKLWDATKNPGSGIGSAKCRRNNKHNNIPAGVWERRQTFYSGGSSQENVETELGGINIPSREKKIEVKKGRVGGCAHHQGGATQTGASRIM
jgi:hypothetical protein